MRKSRVDTETDRLLRGPAENRDKPESVATDMLSRGFGAFETGWVLRHVFGLSMPDAVHCAVTIFYPAPKAGTDNATEIEAVSGKEEKR